MDMQVALAGTHRAVASEMGGAGFSGRRDAIDYGGEAAAGGAAG